MKAEFYYNKRKYACGIFKSQTSNELRIRNDKGEVLAIEQGKKIGFQGKRRESSKQVDVSQPYLYNLIKSAVNALEIAEKDQLLIEKNRIIDGKDEQINILTQQVDILNNSHILSVEQEQKLCQLQGAMNEQSDVNEVQKQRIAQLENKLSQLPQIPLEKIEKKVKTKLSHLVWNSLHPSSQRELCDAYRTYLLIKSEKFTAQIADYSGAGHPLGIIAEREIVTPFFKSLYQFLSTNNKVNVSTSITCEIGGVILRLRGKHTLGDLPALLSSQWETFIDNILEQESILIEENSYRTAFCSNKVSQTDRQLIKQFLQQWQHPLSKWLDEGQLAASKIDQIRKLRNIADHPDSMYLWQFRQLWLLVVGSKTKLGVLQEIYKRGNGEPVP